MAEEARWCKKCDFRWYGKKLMMGKPSGSSGMSDFYALGGHHGAAAASATKKATKSQAKMQEWNRWRYCPNCGSKKVKTVAKKGFVPSGTIQQTAAPAQPVVQQHVAPPPQPSGPPPGWYKDPDGGEALRWWDGTTYTEHRKDAP